MSEQHPWGCAVHDGHRCDCEMSEETRRRDARAMVFFAGFVLAAVWGFLMWGSR